MTDENAASTISHQAWDVGRDSLCDSKTEGVYNFGGLDRTNFYRVADNTALNLSGDGLEAYGISENKAQEFLPRSETISDYYQHCVQESEEASGVVWSALKERGQPRLWVLLHGDDRAAIGQTVGSLTQGSHGQIDISRILDTIDDKDNAATYAKQWRKRRANVGQILRSIDTRVFSIPPNVSVHAARCFGDKTVKSALSGKVGSKPAASNSLRATQVYKEILLALGEQPVSAKASGKIAPFTADEYNRIQALAKNNDEKLNEALGRLFDYTLKEDGFNVVVFTEKRSNIIRGLQVDISIKIADNEYICLEPTWRTTSSGTSGQSTLSEGHIKPYLLEKALKYVAALEL
jgi:hypothetical protein